MFIDEPVGARLEQRLNQSDPTDPQAEFLVFSDIPIKYIEVVGFEDERLLEIANTKYGQGEYENIPFVLAKEYFKSRDFVR
jgi:hypothetical protein